MAKEQRVYGEVNDKSDLRNVFSEIREDVEQADTRSDLTELYRRAGYLITLTNAASWETKFGDEIDELRATAKEEFSKTARAINHRAEEVGTQADYDEEWGD